jgi:DNA gyrase/topoisomerase IV subunit A
MGLMDPDHRKTAMARIEILDALLLSLDRRHEVADLIADSTDELEARDRLRELLQISEVAATEVLNMQWRRSTREGRSELQLRRDEQVAALTS